VKGWARSFQIYQDEVYDLLFLWTPLCDMCVISKSRFEIRGLTKVQVSSSEEILRYFAVSMKRRCTESTAKNATSSRSHLVFKIDICGERSGDPNSYGHLYFTDLAGSEALDAGQTEKQKAEGQQIRNSLTALKTLLVRAADRQKGDARSASICRYMQFVLSRPEAKLLVIANISAEAASFSQTKDALEFVADISKFKKLQDKSPDFLAASEAAAEHDKKKGDSDKPWRRIRLEQQQSGVVRRRETEFTVEFF
jgi:kinesin family member C1